MIISALKVWLFSFLSVMPPYFGFLLTSHVIKEFDRNKKNGIFISLIALLGISFYLRSYIYIMIFLSIYAIIIVGYLLFKRNTFKVEGLGEFDKAVIVSIISTLFVFIIFYINKEYFNSVLLEARSLVLEELNKIFQEDEKIMMEAIENTYNSFISILFIYTFFTYVVTTFISSKNIPLNWSLSYIHIIWYIGAYIVVYLLNIDNIFLKNVLKISRNLYIIYGFKEVYLFIKKRQGEKRSYIGFFLGTLLYLVSPIILFIVGSLGSFNLFKKKF